ncbi:MAG: ABC transporter permease [Methanoregula sp.]|uniref:ABC transporter permease n=1 Tax=Methanoregula sp. TaxID=2052170 RepID=UPI003D14902F
MLNYFIKRVLAAIPTLLCVLLFLFSLIYLLPGDPASVMLGPRATPAMVEALNKSLGLDQPVYVRLGHYIWAILHGDLGESVWSGRSVSSLIMSALPYTIVLTLSSMGLAAFLGIILGVLAAINGKTIVDHLVTVLSLIAVSVPDFVAACLLLLIFAVRFRFFPVIGGGKEGNIVDQIHHLILPVIALSLGWLGYIARLVRDTTLEVLDMDYIKVIRSFGAPNRYIAYKYALKNAIIPVVATIGLGVGKLLGGAVFVELIFNRPGIGKVITDAVFARDLPVVQGGVLVAALLFILANLAADLSYAYFDPRIRYE